MRNLGKRSLALLLTLIMVVSMVPAAFAEEADLLPEEDAELIEVVASEPAEEPVAPAEEPAEPAEEPAVPAEEPAEPAEEPAAPAEEPAEPAEEPAEPAEEEVVVPAPDGESSTDAELVLAAPDGITATGEADGIRITWNPVTGADSYAVLRRVMGETEWQTLTVISGCQYSDMQGVNNTEYEYVIESRSASTSGSYKEENRIAYHYLAAPADVKVENTASGVKITWSAVSSAKFYRVYRKTDSTPWAQVPQSGNVSNTYYEDKTASMSVKYYYTVRALASDGCYGMYNKNGVPVIRLEMPTMQTIENTEKGIKISWTSVTQATGYKVYRKVGINGAWTYIGDTQSTYNYYEDTNVTSGTQYHYAVSAYDKVTDTIGAHESNGINIMCLSKPVLTLTVNVDNTITITWQQVTGATGYYIYRRLDGDVFSGTETEKIDNGATTTWTDKDVINGQLLYYTVQAYYGSSDRSVKDAVGTAAICLPTPHVAEVKNVDTGIEVTWNRVTNVTTYFIYRRVDGTTNWVKVGEKEKPGTSSPITWTDESAAIGVTYYYSVASAFVPGVASQARIGSYETPGKQVTRLPNSSFKSASNGENGIILTWNAVEGATSYNIYRQGAGSSVWAKVGNVTGTTFTDTSISCGTTYRYSVAAVKGTSEGTFGSSWKEIIRLDPVDYSLGNATKGTDSGVKITWAPVTGATSYQVWRKTADTKWTKIEAACTDTEYFDKNVASGTTYTYTIRATGKTQISNETCLSWYSTTGKSITHFAPTKMTKIYNNTNGVTINWTKPDGAHPNTYVILRKVSGGDYVELTRIVISDTDARTTFSYTDTTVLNNNQYTYTVRGIVNGTASDYDHTGLTIVYVKTPVLSKVENRDNTDLPAGTGRILFTWQKVENVTDYTVWRKVSGGSWTKIATGVTETSYEDTTADIGTTYVYTVVANNGGYSSRYDTTGKTITCLDTAKLTGISGNSNGITIKWNKCEGADGYRIYRKTAGSGWTRVGSASASATSYTDTSCQSGVSYYYTVRATKNGYLGYYDTTGKETRRLAAPELVSAYSYVDGSGNSGVHVEWKGVTGAKEYQVWYKQGSGSWQKLGGTVPSDKLVLNATGSSFTAGVKYTFTVTAKYPGASSAYDRTGKTVTYIPAPTFVAYSTNGSLSVKNIRVQWDYPTASGVTFVVYRRLPGASWQKLGQGSAHSYTDKNVTVNTNYEYTVVAVVNGVRSGYYSFGTYSIS